MLDWLEVCQASCDGKVTAAVGKYDQWLWLDLDGLGWVGLDYSMAVPVPVPVSARPQRMPG